MSKRLYRSETDRVLGGVCGGIAEYLKVDSTVIRLLLVLTVIYGGAGVLAYLIFWIVVPTESSVSQKSEDVVNENSKEIKDSVEKVAKNFSEEVRSDTKKENK
jgi:phage shock protein C